MNDPQPGLPGVKECCALAYGSDAARFLLGDSFHPGGLDLTLEVAGMLRLHAASTLLDVACGTGSSAFAIAERFGCRIVGIDLSERNVAEASAEAARRGLHEQVMFCVADAENLPFIPATFDALLCECAFCTFPDKERVAGEFARVLRPGATLGLTDLTRAARPLPELDGLLGWVACIADARSAQEYAAWLKSAGFTIALSVERDAVLSALVDQVRTRLMVADVMIGLKKLELRGLDLRQAKEFAAAAAVAVKDGSLGYALVVAERPS